MSKPFDQEQRTLEKTVNDHHDRASAGLLQDFQQGIPFLGSGMFEPEQFACHIYCRAFKPEIPYEVETGTAVFFFFADGEIESNAFAVGVGKTLVL